MAETIELYEAIRQMRLRSQQGKTFSFAHATYDRSRCSSHGVRYVNQARVRPAAKADDLVHADEKLFYFDEDLQENRNCWQILIMYFEDKQVTLN